MNKQLRARIVDLLGSRIPIGDDDANAKVIEDLKEEVHKANLEIDRLQEGIECKPQLTETLLNAEEEEADRWKKMHQLVRKERDSAIRKNADLSLSLREARKAMSTLASSSHPAVPMTPTPASPVNLPSTFLASATPAAKANTPTFPASDTMITGTPKATSWTRHLGPPVPPPPSVGNNSVGQNIIEMDGRRASTTTLRRDERVPELASTS